MSSSSMATVPGPEVDCPSPSPHADPIKTSVTKTRVVVVSGVMVDVSKVNRGVCCIL